MPMVITVWGATALISGILGFLLASAKRRSAEEPRQGALYERLARQRAQTLERGARAQRRKRRFGRGYKLAHLITLPSA